MLLILQTTNLKLAIQSCACLVQFAVNMNDTRMIIEECTVINVGFDVCFPGRLDDKIGVGIP